MIYPTVLQAAGTESTYSQVLTLSLNSDAAAKTGATSQATTPQTVGMGLTAFGVVEGSLPKGMTLGADGRLGGRPTHPGTSRFTVEAEDENGYVSRRSYELRVDRPGGQRRR